MRYFVSQVVNCLLKKLGLSYHRRIISERYSCGTRRKLSTALALIGQPQLLLLVTTSSTCTSSTPLHSLKQCTFTVYNHSSDILHLSIC